MVLTLERALEASWEHEMRAERAEARIAALEAENAKLREAVVFAVKWQARMADFDKSLMWIWVDEEAYSIPCDGTPAGIVDAVLRAMGGGGA